MADLPDVARELGPWGYLLATVLFMVLTSFTAAVGWVAKKVHEGVIWAGRLGERIASGHLTFIESMSLESQKQSTLLSDLNEKIDKWGTSTFQEQIADRVYSKVKHGLEERGCKLSDEEVKILVDTHKKRKTSTNERSKDAE